MTSRIFFYKLTLFLLLIVSVSQIYASKRPSQDASPVQQLQYENKKAQALASFAKILNLLDSQYVDPESVDIDTMIQKALTAMVSGLDPHSAYLSPEQFRKFIHTDSENKKQNSSVQMSDLSHNIAYLKLSIFDSSSYEEVRSGLKNFQSSHRNKLNGLVLDVRDNPGGLFDQAIRIANLFVDSGIIVTTMGRDSHKPQQVEYALKYETFDQFPIIVLVNEMTASSSEILAGALQDRDRALIMGDTTYGKGSVQKVVPLPNGGAVKFTVARYYTPSGRSLQAEGVIPDVMFIPHGEGKLKNHITNKRLQIAIQKKSVYQEIDNWSSKLKGDEVLKQAYLYLRQAL